MLGDNCQADAREAGQSAALRERRCAPMFPRALSLLFVLAFILIFVAVPAVLANGFAEIIIEGL
jgi:hypothetical protein